MPTNESNFFDDHITKKVLCLYVAITIVAAALVFQLSKDWIYIPATLLLVFASLWAFDSKVRAVRMNQRLRTRSILQPPQPSAEQTAPN